MNDVWATDVVSDRRFDGRLLLILTTLDCCAREALSTVPRTDFQAYQLIEEPNRPARLRGKPRSIRVDNGPECADQLKPDRKLA